MLRVKNPKYFLFPFAAIGCFAGLALSASAQLPAARLTTLTPPGGKAGSTVELKLSGVDLEAATQLYVSNPGITAKPKLNASGQPEANQFTVAIAPNVPPGVYETHVAGRFGISNSRAFVVGDLAEVNEKAPNNTVAAAMEIALGTVVNGTAAPNTVDYFKFTAKKGQRVLVDCQTRSIDSRMDAVVVLNDVEGNELERSRRGGLLDFTAPADGVYYLKIHDFTFRGGAEHFYRLTVRTGPHIDFIFPPSGLAGTKSKYTLFGRNLPGGTPVKGLMIEGKQLEQLIVEIELPGDPLSRLRLSTSALIKPADTVVDGIEYRLISPQGVSNPVLLSFATGPVVAQQYPNNKPELAQKISVPCEYVGQFYPPSEPSWVTFEAKKGDVYWVEVFSQRLGLPTDPFAVIQRVVKKDKGGEQGTDVLEMYDNDTNIGGTDFNTATRDPAGRLAVPEDGTYRIQVRDLFNRAENNPRLVYRLSIRKESPDFRLVAMAPAPPPVAKDTRPATVWSLFIRRGETTPIRVMAFRRDNFAGDIQLSVEGLPPGITAADTKLEVGKNSVSLMLVAAENAAPWVGPIKVVGKTKIGDADVVREARSGSVIWNVVDFNLEAIQSRMTRDLTLAVGVEATPMTIEAVENKVWETSVAGILPIPIKLTRRMEFGANLKLKAVGITLLDPMPEIDVDGKATNATLTLDLAKFKIPVGTHSFYLQTQTPGKYRNDPEAAKAADDAVKSLEKQIADLNAAAKQAADGKPAAAKVVADTAAAAKQAADALAAAVKTVSEAEALAKGTVEKSTTAKADLEAAEKARDKATADLKALPETTPADAKTAAAKLAVEANTKVLAAADVKTAAEKAVEEAAAKSKAAAEAKVAAEKAVADANAKAKSAVDAVAAADKLIAETPAKLKDTESKKVTAVSVAKDANTKATPKDVTVTFYSKPIVLKVTAAPITLAATAASQVEQGAKVEYSVTVTRLYGFVDPVEVNLVLPAGVSGLNAAKLVIPKDQTQGKLVIEAAANATPGDHKLTLQAALKLNTQDLKVDQPVTLKVSAKAK